MSALSEIHFYIKPLVDCSKITIETYIQYTNVRMRIVK